MMQERELAAEEASRIMQAAAGGVVSIPQSAAVEAAGHQATGLAVRSVSQVEREQLRWWERENRNNPLSWMKRKLGVLRSDKDVPWPRLLFLGLGQVRGWAAEAGAEEEGSVLLLRVCNASTRQYGVFRQRESIIVPCATSSDTVVVQAFKNGARLDSPLGFGVLHIRETMVTESGALETNLLLSSSKSIHLPVDMMWIHESRRKTERGSFYYRVLKGFDECSCVKEPERGAQAIRRFLKAGDVFISPELSKDMSDGTVWVKVPPDKSTALFSPCAWLPEHLPGEDPWLDRVEPPRTERGHYFFRLASDTRLYGEPTLDAEQVGELLPAGTVIEALEKFTPPGASASFIKCLHHHGGYIVESRADPTRSQLLGKDGNIVGEAIPCPDGENVQSSEEASIYRVVAEEGALVHESAHLSAVCAESLALGTPFSTSSKLEIEYPGIGRVLFVRRAQDGKWVRASSSDRIFAEEVLDIVEQGPFYYTVVHEHGVVVRSAPDLNAPPAKPHTILPLQRRFRVVERVRKAQDIVASSSPIFFLRVDSEQLPITSSEGWVFDKRQTTSVCKETTQEVAQAQQT